MKALAKIIINSEIEKLRELLKEEKVINDSFRRVPDEELLLLNPSNFVKLAKKEK